jgi:hypothetical protein
MITAQQAVAVLNQQRAANGIPGDLTVDPTLSQGCFEYANLYQPKPGQLPHLELPSQPGYTALGDQAARHSDLSGGAGEWSWLQNPWTDAPYHLQALFDPGATVAWYGESDPAHSTHFTACMGTGGIPRQLPSPSFYSYPGDGATNVEFAERAAESNASNQADVPGDQIGLPSGATTGPNFILYVERAETEGNYTVRAASLVGADGRSYEVRVTPDDGFAIVARPLEPSSR